MLDHETVARQITLSDETHPDKESFLTCLEHAKKISSNCSLVMCIERTMELLE